MICNKCGFQNKEDAKLLLNAVITITAENEENTEEK